MFARIATLGVATVTVLCVLAPAASADGGILDLTYTGGTTVGVIVGTGDSIEDICAQVITSGAVTATLGGCEPTPWPTHPLTQGSIGEPDVLWVDWLVQVP